MKYEVRECPIKFDLEYGGFEGTQTCYFEINGEKYSWRLSYAMGSLFGTMLNAVYGLFIEVLDQRCNNVMYECNSADNSSVITSITSSSNWENEGEELQWTFRRDLSREDLMIDMTINYEFGEKVYEDQISLRDISYAVTRALTNYIKQIGFCGYHFAAVDDSIDIVRFLVVKHYALTGEMKTFHRGGDEGEGKNGFSFEEEIELIKQPM